MNRSCTQCSVQFEIDQRDQDFYDRNSLPKPTFCPDCRRQRRSALRNERHLYNRHCDLCEVAVISVFPKDSEFIVYCYDCWWSDKWDVMDYAREYNFSKSFFEQFSELDKAIPHIALFQDGSSENCEYVNFGVENKNCYLALCAYCEDVYYSYGAIKSKSCVDCTKVLSCELCYECVDCMKCYNLAFSQDCLNCNDSYFLKDCMACTNCFSSVGLRNSEYVFMNEQLSEEEYKRRLNDIRFNHDSIREWLKKLNDLSLTIPKKFMHVIASEDVTGDYVENSKNLKDCFDGLALEGSAYCDLAGFNSRDLYDCTNVGMGSECCYEMNGVTASNNSKFLYYCREINDTQYSQHCYFSSDLFGCFGLRRKQYCVFNKQYSKEEYEKLVAKIIESMRESKEYGEYFPVSISPFAYNETLSCEYFPLTKEETLDRGYKWRDIEEKAINSKLPSCEDCGRNYKMIAQELKFYKAKDFPVPKKCPDCRHRARFLQRNSRKLWDRKCDNCGLGIRSTYSPDQPEIVYCEKCYLKELY